MTLSNLIKDPSPGVTPGDGSSINTDQWNKVVDGLSGDSTVWNHSSSPYTFFISRKGSTFYAKSGIDGTLINSGDTNLDNVLTSVKTYIGTGVNPTIDRVLGLVGPGAFPWTNTFDWDRGNIHVKGSGMGVTEFQQSASAADTAYFGIAPSNATVTDNLTIDAAAGATTLTASGTTTYAAGDYILVRENTNIDPEIANRRKGELHLVQSYNAGTHVITIGTSGSFGGSMINSYTVGASATIDKLPNFYKNVTFSDMSFTDLATSRANTLTAGQTRWRFIRNLSFNRVQFHDMFYSGVQLYQVMNTHLIGCDFQRFQDTTPTQNTFNGLEIRGACINILGLGTTFDNSRHSVTAAAGGPFASTLCGGPRNISVGINGYLNTITAHMDAHNGCDNVVFVGNVAVGDDTAANGIQSRSPVVAVANGILAVIGGCTSLDSGVNTGAPGAVHSVVVANKLDGGTNGVIIQNGVHKSLIGLNMIPNTTTGYPISFDANANTHGGDDSLAIGNWLGDNNGTTYGINFNSNSNTMAALNRIIAGTAARTQITNATGTNIILRANMLTGLGGTPLQAFSNSNTHFVMNNFGINDLGAGAGAITNPFNNGNLTIDPYSGNAAAPTAANVYTCKYSPLIVNVTVAGGCTAVLINGTNVGTIVGRYIIGAGETISFTTAAPTLSVRQL